MGFIWNHVTIYVKKWKSGLKTSFKYCDCLENDKPQATFFHIYFSMYNTNVAKHYDKKSDIFAEASDNFTISNNKKAIEQNHSHTHTTEPYIIFCTYMKISRNNQQTLIWSKYVSRAWF